MQIIDVLEGEPCRKIFLEVQKFVEISLSQYNNRLEKGDFEYSDKDIFDFIWGTIDFSKAEICILDSPLVQRLRRIHHLGMADVVYCNANSSRFSHTIGVTEVAGRMARNISSKLEKNKGIYDFVEIVRLAAIFHDTGHMFYSHVSELYFAHDDTFPRYREITDMKAFFCKCTSSNAALHEIFSVMIVNSPETIRLLKNIAPHMKKTRVASNREYRQLAEYISSLIIGTPIDRMILPYASIINSSIDADKLDYLSRDSESTKVPIAVDIARIIQKLDVVNIKQIEYPKIWSDSKSENEPLKIMAIKNSAKKVFWQLSNARSSLYESVYYHHKVLTAETMFRKALRRLYRDIGVEKINFTDILQWTDDIFNDYWYLTIYPNDIDEITKGEVCQILNKIKERNLYKRVAAFSRESLKGELSAIRSFVRNVIQDSKSDAHKAFMNDLEKEYRKIRSLLGEEEQKLAIPHFMFAYVKYDAMASMPIESNDNFIWSSSLMKQETMEAGKKSRQEQFYLLTDCKDRVYVYLALEKVLAKYKIIQLAKEASICSKVPFDEMYRKRKRLLEKNYYKDALSLLQDDIFVDLLDCKMIDSIVRKYRSFHGAGECKIEKQRLLFFLRQFLRFELTKTELEMLLDGILRLLNSAYYIDRELCATHVPVLLDKISGIPYERKHIIFLGGILETSHHFTYYFNDIQERKNFIFDVSVEAAFRNAEEDRLLCFFDDGAYSGRQVVSIFQEFMGIPVEERATNEHHVDELSEENKENLRKSKIVLLYLCFNPEAQEYIRAQFKELGIMNVEIHYCKDLSIKKFDEQDSIFKSEEQRELVKSCLKEIGEEVVLSIKKLESGKYKERWDEQRVMEAALGYNDAQQMVVCSNNVPKYLISAFWCNGKAKGMDWTGLFQRTE